MRIARVIWLAVLSGSASVPAWSQGRAALDQLLAHHTEAEVDHMRQHAHYRYEGELLFYSSSFLVVENGAERPATEDEIAGIDLHAYDGIRLEERRSGVHDPLIDRHIVLLARREFERLVVDRLSAADRAAYQAYKDAVLVQPDSRTR